ncbi:MAG: hypothetical protein M2R46_03277 [Verrucomicrobia subdivision 3 bacterium]|nr:hypothetical protein [Limisphaerales bacterium]
MKTDRPRRTGQGLKLTLAALLTALALQPAAVVAQSIIAVSTLGQPQTHTMRLRGSGESMATQFTVGPPREGFTGWKLDKITGGFGDPGGSPSTFGISILNDDSGAPGSLDSPLATLTGDAPLRNGRYDFLSPAGTTISLEPETSYWLTYTHVGGGNSDFYRLGVTNRANEDSGTLPGWSIGDTHWQNLDGSRWREFNQGGLSLPYRFGVFVTPVPEPSEYALFFALGLGAFALWHRRRLAGQRTVA